MVEIAVLITCHNRKDFTLACLDALASSLLPAGLRCTVFLVDDGSTDGTSEAIMARHPSTRIFKGDGTLFWNQGMRMAWSEASKLGADFYLWLNDDTILYEDALARLIQTHDEVQQVSGKGAIVVGTTCTPGCKTRSYGGVRRRSWFRPITLDPVQPEGVPVRCDTFEGNVVLVPASVASLIGNLDPEFVHAGGDTDYGFRASREGCVNWVMPGFAGTCSRNPSQNTFADPSLSLGRRLKTMANTKGLPLRAWYVITRRHTGPLWIVYWLWPYVRVIVGSAFGR